MKKFVFDILDWTTEGGDDPDQFFGRIIFVGIMSIFAFLFFGSIIHGFFDMITISVEHVMKAITLSNGAKWQ